MEQPVYNGDYMIVPPQNPLTLVHITYTDTVGEFAFEPFSVKWAPSSISVECDDRRLLSLHDLLQYEFANSITYTNVN